MRETAVGCPGLVRAVAVDAGRLGRTLLGPRPPGRERGNLAHARGLWRRAGSRLAGQPGAAPSRRLSRSPCAGHAGRLDHRHPRGAATDDAGLGSGAAPCRQLRAWRRRSRGPTRAPARPPRQRVERARRPDAGRQLCRTRPCARAGAAAQPCQRARQPVHCPHASGRRERPCHRTHGPARAAGQQVRHA